MSVSFSIKRAWAVCLKEFVQMRRDRMTFIMMVGIPVIQLVLFGFAINTDPKNLDTVVLDADHGVYSRTVLATLKNTGYFNIIKHAGSEQKALESIKKSNIKFVINIPPDFTRNMMKGKNPSILIEADAVDPSTVGHAIYAANEAIQFKFTKTKPPLNLVIHRKYNPEQISQLNIVPCLLGLILTLMMIFIISLSMTRETERGTMENLLCLPVKPLEVLTGKILPYVLIGLLESFLVLIGARLIFGVPIVGSISLLFISVLFFIAANLAVGITFSTIARTQLQAIQMSILFFLPSILLSGFMFPFEGMPRWAQYVGFCLPMTHFNKIVRGIMLKGAGFSDISFHLACIAVFMLVALTVGAVRYRRTLD